MKILLCPNGYTLAQAEQARSCIEALEQAGHVCSVSKNNIAPEFQALFSTTFDAAECDLVLSIGGDGALLRAAHLAFGADRPVAGINSGRLGHLCLMQLSDMHRFDPLLAAAVCEDRLVLQFEYDGTPYYAINDVIIAKKNYGQTVDLTVGIDKNEGVKVRGDGLILATPTGSTAYNFSAGGPILFPTSHSMVITPICAHAAHSAPIVLGDEHTITVSERDKAAELFADGTSVGMLSHMLSVHKAGRTLKLYVPRGFKLPE